jgi:hypothetical protein
VTLTSLRADLSPPPRPLESGSPEEWSRVEERLGSRLPSDYKEYIDTYGTGQINGLLWPHNPFAANRFLNLFRLVADEVGALRRRKDLSGDEVCPYPLYPEPGGLLPWGLTDNGDVLFWLTKGQPDGWLVVVNGTRSPEYDEYDESMTSFLTKLVAGVIVSRFFSRFAEGGPTFRSVR